MYSWEVQTLENLQIRKISFLKRPDQGQSSQAKSENEQTHLFLQIRPTGAKAGSQREVREQTLKDIVSELGDGGSDSAYPRISDHFGVA